MSLFNPDIAAAWKPADTDWVVVAYRDNRGFMPKNFAEGTEAYRQWTYSGRRKGDKELLKQLLEGVA